MAFVWTSPSSASSGTVIKVDIIGVPAIGADPRKTWTSSNADHPPLFLGNALHEEIPSARILLYDHLKPEERRLEVKELSDPEHTATAKEFASVENAVAQYGTNQWADRLMEAVREDRASQNAEKTPILFVCHSTGGIIVKRAITKRVMEGVADISAECLGVAFFATPHRGSSVLSEPEYVQTVQKTLGLKWEMSEHLRQEFSVQNRDLEILDYKFGPAALGMKIWSLVETRETQLKVLSTGDVGGETLTPVKLSIVDSRSAVLSTTDVPVEEEEIFRLDATHVGVPRFANDDIIRRRYLEDLAEFIQHFSVHEREAHHQLASSIMTDIHVDIHQFYEFGPSGEQEKAPLKVWSERPTLRTFLEEGPAQCLRRRFKASVEQPDENGQPDSSTEVRRSTKAVAPTIVVAPPTELPEAIPPRDDRTSLTARVSEKLTTIHTRRPSLTPRPSTEPIMTGNGHLAPQAASPPVKEFEYQDIDSARPPQKPPTYQLPSSNRDRFRWIHIPYTHAGWVPLVLMTVSNEKDNLDLHKKLLVDQIWMSQHNRSRHASPHARFVRPSCQGLFPKDHSHSHLNSQRSPSSATREVQLVLYLPYLHWDTFKHLNSRADTIKKRRKQDHARPVDQAIASGNSMESKLIWQYLTSNRPIHCRRTLDQYGYPSLRNTSVRDGDQILYKRTRPARPETEPRESPMKHITSILRANRFPAGQTNRAPNDDASKVLMVDQLWLWVIDQQTVITFAAPKEKEDIDTPWKLGDLRSNIYRDVNGDYARQCDDCFDFAALVVFHAVKALLDITDDDSLQVFRIFEEYISVLTEQQTKSFKEFRDNHRNTGSRGLDVHRLPKYVDNKKDLDALLELRDIEDELGSIGKLFRDQHRSIADMIKHYRELNAKYNQGINGTELLQEAKWTIDGYQEQLDEMLKSAQTAHKAFIDLLDMKQKQANVVEAHLTREQTEVAADQSRSVMIFTIFTIIFLPLSFFASVFGINAREWSGTETNLPLSSIFIYMGTISLGLIIVALLAAFNRFTRRVMQYLWKVIAKPFVVWFHYVLARVAPLEDERVDTRQAARETRMPSIASALGAETDDFEVINTTHDIV